mgnify:CR=1 FL=1
MSSIFYDQFGQTRKWNDVRAAESLLLLKRKSGADPWPVIERCIKVWENTSPTEWKSYLYDLGTIRSTRKDKKFASTKDKFHGGYLRYTLDIPEKVMYLMRAMYSTDELPMNKEFFLEFSKRFPRFKVAEKL